MHENGMRCSLKHWLPPLYLKTLTKNNTNGTRRCQVLHPLRVQQRLMMHYIGDRTEPMLPEWNGDRGRGTPSLSSRSFSKRTTQKNQLFFPFKSKFQRHLFFMQGFLQIEDLYYFPLGCTEPAVERTPKRVFHNSFDT
ncbi:hypothetical protein NPIL_367481 [Nephila pilipes]|uniref:Uncharacterized protein n=1 Tax=Nephila pilipes TaxID=299642 RepID=A0A8X6PL67_NEPPI|nr:hypothetical protein NPIL_367481 [Nephila pilipes]